MGCKTSSDSYLCPICRGQVFEPSLSSVAGVTLWTLGSYEGLLKQCVLKIKDRGHRALASELSLLAAEHIVQHLSDHKVDALLSVPSSREGSKFRGFSIPRMIEESLLNLTDWPSLEEKLRLQYRRGMKTSRGLSRAERLERVEKGDLCSQEAVPNRGTLLLIDDVVTTGATLSYCIKQASTQGFSEILCFAIAEHRPGP